MRCDAIEVSNYVYSSGVASMNELFNVLQYYSLPILEE